MDRRADDHRLNALAERVEKIEHNLATNTKMTEEVHANTTAIVEAWRAVGGGLKVLGWLGSAAKWLAAFLAAVAAVYAALHSSEVTNTAAISVRLPK